MSEDRFAEAVAPVQETWNSKFYDPRVYLVTSRRCEECGRGFYPSGLPQVECNECARGMAETLGGLPR